MVNFENPFSEKWYLNDFRSLPKYLNALRSWCLCKPSGRYACAINLYYQYKLLLIHKKQ